MDLSVAAHVFKPREDRARKTMLRRGLALTKSALWAKIFAEHIRVTIERRQFKSTKKHPPTAAQQLQRATHSHKLAGGKLLKHTRAFRPIEAFVFPLYEAIAGYKRDAPTLQEEQALCAIEARYTAVNGPAHQSQLSVLPYDAFLLVLNFTLGRVCTDTRAMQASDWAPWRIAY